MKKTIGWIVACSLSLFACNVEHYDGCSDDEVGGDDETGLAGSPSKAGSVSTAGAASAPGTGGSGDVMSPDAGSEGGAAPTSPEVVTCDDEHDCRPGFNCNLEAHECQATDEETCGELTSEAACTHRTDCTPIYAGINCSCGQDCECKGGEPGCVCERFDFFACQAAP